MELGLRGRTAVVTGASQGIGRACVLQLAAEGVHVLGAARRFELVDALRAELDPGTSGRVVGIEYDMLAPGATQRLAQAALDEFGHVDIIVNAAGRQEPATLEGTAAQWDEGMAINFHPARDLTHALLTSMCSAKWGRVINFMGTMEPAALSYSIPAKAALQSWSKTISREVAKYNVTVNGIHPGRVMSEQLMRWYPTPEAITAHAMKYVPMQRFGEAREAANVAVFLASEAASYVTGVVIQVDGGARLSAF